MKKIGVFIDRWLSGGIESYLVSNFENMDLSDIDITIITTRKFSDLYDDRLKEMGIEIKELFSEGKDVELTRTIASLKVFKKIMKDDRYDVLHLNIYNGVSLVYSKIAQECGVKRIIAHSHSSAMGQVRLRRLKILSHKLGKIRYQKFLSDYWACSDLAGEWLFTTKYKEKVIIMNNGIDTDKFRYSEDKRVLFREKYNLSEDELVLGNIGRMTNEKNQLFLLDIALELRRKGIKFTLLIAGDGGFKEEIERKSDEYGLGDKVRLIGTISDTPSFYSGIDIFLLPSLFEGNPTVGIEAQCSGVKCVFSETITKQAKVIDTTLFSPLDATDEWVKQIESFQYSENSRDSVYDMVKKKDYDITDTSKSLKASLLL